MGYWLFWGKLCVAGDWKVIADGTSVEAELLGAFDELLTPVSSLSFPALYLCTCNPHL